MPRTPGERAMSLGCIGGVVRVLGSTLKLVLTSFFPGLGRFDLTYLLSSAARAGVLLNWVHYRSF